MKPRSSITPDWCRDETMAALLPYAGPPSQGTEPPQIGDKSIAELMLEPPTTTIYFAQCVGAGLIKIGISNNWQSRARQLYCENALPVYIIAHMPGTRALEQAIHSHFHWHHYKGEWFIYGDEIDDFIHETECVIPTNYLGGFVK